MFRIDKDDEVDKLKDQVNNLTQLVGFLSSAIDNISRNQAVMSDTVNNLVMTEEQSLQIQEKLVNASNLHSTQLEQIGNGIQNLLTRLLPPSSSNPEGDQ